MAMKKTSSGDSPLRQGARKSIWTLLIFGSTAVADRDVFWKSDQVLRFFPSGGLYRRRGIVKSGPRHPVWGPPGPTLRLLFGSLEASVNFWTFGFGFVQFQEYFLCNFSETQK
jgi:hypothetical protein